MFSVYALFSFAGVFDGLTGSIGATHVDSVWSGFSKTVKLPGYTLAQRQRVLRDPELEARPARQEPDGRAIFPLELPGSVRFFGGAAGAAAQLPGLGGLQVLT